MRRGKLNKANVNEMDHGLKEMNETDYGLREINGNVTITEVR